VKKYFKVPERLEKYTSAFGVFSWMHTVYWASAFDFWNWPPVE